MKEFVDCSSDKEAIEIALEWYMRPMYRGIVPDYINDDPGDTRANHHGEVEAVIVYIPTGNGACIRAFVSAQVIKLVADRILEINKIQEVLSMD